MYEIENIRENYRNFYDEKIIDIAKHESKGLRPEVLEILKEEIIKRNLDLKLINWVVAESRPITDYEKETLKYKIQGLSCPNCQKQKKYLRGFEINTVVSTLIFCSETTEEKILCEDCGNKEKLKSIVLTLLLGWWSRRGIFMTPITLTKDIINLFYLKRISDRIFDEFIETNIGRIRLRGETENALTSLVKNYNKKTTKNTTA